MSDPTTGSTHFDQVRGIEMRMWEEIGSQLKEFASVMREFGADLRDVRERMIRIEAQDQPLKIAKLEDAMTDAHDEIARVERDYQAMIAKAQQHDANERQKLMADHAADKLALEKRLTRTETIMAPLLAFGSALLAAGGAAFFTWMQSHVH